MVVQRFELEFWLLQAAALQCPPCDTGAWEVWDGTQGLMRACWASTDH